MIFNVSAHLSDYHYTRGAENMGDFWSSIKRGLCDDLFFERITILIWEQQDGPVCCLWKRTWGLTVPSNNIENAPFRTKWQRGHGNERGTGDGSISGLRTPAVNRTFPSRNLFHRHSGQNKQYRGRSCPPFLHLSHIHFLEWARQHQRHRFLVATIINQSENIMKDQYAQDLDRGPMTILIMTPKGI